MDNSCVSDLRCKEVINICTGERLGYVSDVYFNICDGKITDIAVPGECGILGLPKGKDILIPWCDITQIGEDIILVKSVNVRSSCDCGADGEREKKKKRFF